MRRKKLMMLIPIGILAIALFIGIGGGLVSLLWNSLAPPLFGWPEITFWQGLALLALCRILFGGWGGGGAFSRSRFRRRMAERWESMTPEERERFRQGVRGRCGLGPAAGENQGQ